MPTLLEIAQHERARRNNIVAIAAYEQGRRALLKDEEGKAALAAGIPPEEVMGGVTAEGVRMVGDKPELEDVSSTGRKIQPVGGLSIVLFASLSPRRSAGPAGFATSGRREPSPVGPRVARTRGRQLDLLERRVDGQRRQLVLDVGYRAQLFL